MTIEKKPYHKKRHPWRNQDLRSPDKRATTRMPPPPERRDVKPVDLAANDGCVLCGCKRRAPRHNKPEMQGYHLFEKPEPPVDLFALSETPCPRCMALAQEGSLRTETVQRMPINPAAAPSAHDGSGKCCRDCGFADGLVARRIGMYFPMARIAVGNCRQEQYRLPGAPMGLVLQGLRPSKPGDLEDQHKWLDRMDWFGTNTEDEP